MQKVLTFPHAATQQTSALPAASPAPTELLERSGHTFIGSVLFLDIVEYARKPVAEQLEVKERFNACLAQAIADISSSDRIILDTGDGAAVNFLGDPEDALFVAMNLADLVARAEPKLAIEVRSGINLGPVRLVRDINGQPNIIGDGINVAQRVMSFAQSGQVLVSRSYHEVVTRLSQDYAQLFSYQGSRTDKHVREHEIYEVCAPFAQVQELAARRQRERPSRGKQLAPMASPGSWLRSRTLAFGFLALAAAALGVAAFFSLARHEAPPPVAAAAAPRLSPPPAPAEIKPAIAAEPAPSTPTPETAAAAELPQPASKGEREAASRDAQPDLEAKRTRPVNAHAALTAAPAVPALIRTEPRVETPVETKAEPASQKPVTLPTQYRAATGPTALVMLAISPWGEVVVDGKVAGVSPPMAELELAPGKHRIEIRNGAFKPYQTELELGSNETTRIKHKFVQGR
jgi:class 3 adenylate cyclase